MRKHTFLTVVLGGLVLVALWQSLVIVPPGQRGLVSTMGRLQPEVLNEGPHVIWPWQQVQHSSFQFSPVTQEVHGLSKDRLPLQVRLTVAYHVEPRDLPAVQRDIGVANIESKVVLPALQNAPETVFSVRRAEVLVDQRPEVTEALKGAVAERLQRHAVRLDEFDAVFIFPAATLDAVAGAAQAAKKTEAEVVLAPSPPAKAAVKPPAKGAAK